MADIYRQRTFKTRTGVGESAEPKPRLWQVALNYLFYVVAALVVGGFLYYLYSFNRLLLIYLPIFLQGTLTTLTIAILSVILAIILGFIGALGRLSHVGVFRWIAYAYVEVIRGTPAYVQILFWFNGAGYLLALIGFDPYATAYQVMTALQSNSFMPDSPGVFNAMFYGTIGLGFNYGAYLTEVFRTGIESVDKGQREAGLSLGLNSRQIMRRVILPQAIRITIPPFTNYFITLIQDTSLLSLISVVELEHQTYAFALPQVDPNNKLFLFIFGGLFYLILCYPLSLLARYFEARFAVAYDS